MRAYAYASPDALRPLPASRSLKNPASIRRRRPLAVMPAPWAPRDPIHMASKVGLAGSSRSAGLTADVDRFTVHSSEVTMSSTLALSVLSAGAPFARTTIERRELRDNDVSAKPATPEIATCWSCERPIALKPERASYHCESCDVWGSDEPALVRTKMTEQTYFFLGWNGQARFERYVDHNDSSLSSPA